MTPVRGHPSRIFQRKDIKGIMLGSRGNPSRERYRGMGSIVKLEGNWEFGFDPVDAGLIDQWYRKRPAQLKKVTLPHVWNSETNDEAAHIGYYFKEFTVDKKESP